MISLNCLNTSKPSLPKSCLVRTGGGLPDQVIILFKASLIQWNSLNNMPMVPTSVMNCVLKFGATYILLLGMILCPSLNQVTCGLGQLGMGSKLRTAACPWDTVFLWSASMKFPISAEKNQTLEVPENSFFWGGRVKDRNNYILPQSHRRCYN